MAPTVSLSLAFCRTTLDLAWHSNQDYQRITFSQITPLILLVKGSLHHRQGENRQRADPGRVPTWTPGTAIPGKGNRATRGQREEHGTAQELSTCSVQHKAEHGKPKSSCCLAAANHCNICWVVPRDLGRRMTILVHRCWRGQFHVTSPEIKPV